jgi:hypothetical protein
MKIELSKEAARKLGLVAKYNNMSKSATILYFLPDEYMKKED